MPSEPHVKPLHNKCVIIFIRRYWKEMFPFLAYSILLKAITIGADTTLKMHVVI
jgi:hypothetical protein